MPLIKKICLKSLPLLVLITLHQIAFAGASERRNEVVVAVEKVGAAVVNVRAEQRKDDYEPFNFGDPFFDEFFRDFFEPRYKKETIQTSLGSGVIISKDGFIVTNQHVIRSTSDIKVILSDNREFQAKVIGADPATDIAVLKIKSEAPLPFIELGRSSELMIGETVIAIGNPYGLSHTVTTGVVSAVGRTVKTKERTYTNFIQTDASINPGNSGGPLLNIDGDVIGINTAIYERAQGIGFAIPADVVKNIVDNLMSYGEVHKGWVGMQVQELTKELADYFGYPNTKAILVSKVYENSPARETGVRAGDIIVSINKTNTVSKKVYDELLRQYTTGAKLTLKLFRKGAIKELELTTRDFPNNYYVDYLEDLMGLTLADVSKEYIRRFNIKTREGVLILDVKESEFAYKNGIRAGDVIRKVDDHIIRNKAELFKALMSLKHKKAYIMLLIQRGKYGYYVSLNLSY